MTVAERDERRITIDVPQADDGTPGYTVTLDATTYNEIRSLACNARDVALAMTWLFWKGISLSTAVEIQMADQGRSGDDMSDAAHGAQLERTMGPLDDQMRVLVNNAIALGGIYNPELVPDWLDPIVELRRSDMMTCIRVWDENDGPQENEVWVPPPVASDSRRRQRLRTRRRRP